MSNEVGIVKYEIDGNEIKLSPSIVQTYILGNSETTITAQEYKMFVELCKVRKLNPFLKEAYLIKYGNQSAQIIVGKDAILKRAIKHPQFNGREQGIILLKDDGSVEERKGTFRLETEKLVGGWARVHRKDIEFPTYISVTFDEVAQRKKDGTLNSNWETKGGTMVEKVALVRALRETFVEELGGMIDADEAWLHRDEAEEQVDVIVQEEPVEVVDVEVVEAQSQSLDDL